MLKGDLNRHEQYSRHECLEVRGVVFRKSKNTNDIVKEIGSLAGGGIQDRGISMSHRLTITKMEIQSW